MRSDYKDLRPLLEPGSLVVIGASQEPARIGGRPLELARAYGFEGQVAGVNRKYTEVQGFPCFPEVSALPFTPDLAVLAVGAKDVLATLQACVEKGVRAAVIFAGGFAETGTPQGAELQRAVADLAERSGLLVCGPNTIGLVNVERRTYATFMTAMLEAPPIAGDVALVAQSGGACIAVHHHLHRRGVGVSYLLSTGNEAHVDFHDCVEHVTADPRTRVLVGYIEGLDRGDRLLDQLQRLDDRNLPVVLYKVGETQAGADAAASHTARMAGSHSVFKAAFDQLGVMYADDMEQLAELAYLARYVQRSSGLRAAILTTSGAFAAILTDKFIAHGLTVPALSAGLQERLRPHVPVIATVGNPVDITANVVNSPGGFGEALAILLDSDEIDFVVLFSTSNLIDKLAPEIVRCASESKRLLAVMVTGTTHAQAELEHSGVPVFLDTGRGARALSTLGHRQARRSRKQPWRRPSWTPNGRAEQARELLATARRQGRRALDEHEGKKLLAIYGIDVALEVLARSLHEVGEAADAIGYPQVMKIVSPDIVHKTDVGGVRLNLTTRQAVLDAHEEMRRAVAAAAPDARIEGVLMQRQESTGNELLLSATQDPLFGPTVTVGFGGVTAELLCDIQQRLAPVDNEDALEMMRQLRLYPLLAGYRGLPQADIDATVRAITALSALAMDLQHEVAEVEVNPLIVRPGAAAGVVAVDCVVKLR